MDRWTDGVGKRRVTMDEKGYTRRKGGREVFKVKGSMIPICFCFCHA